MSRAWCSSGKSNGVQEEGRSVKCQLGGRTSARMKAPLGDVLRRDRENCGHVFLAGSADGSISLHQAYRTV